MSIIRRPPTRLHLTIEQDTHLHQNSQPHPKPFTPHPHSSRKKKWKVPSEGKYQQEIKKAYEAQQRLGKSALWKGLLIQKLGDIQESVYRDTHSPKEKTGTRWSRLAVKLLHSHFESLWKQRSELYHGKTKKA